MSGWASAFAGGLCLTLAFPPVRAWPLVFAVPVLWVLALVDHPERPFRRGFVLGAAGFGPMLTWIAAPAGWLAWSLLVALQASFVGLASLLLVPWIRHRWMPLIAATAWTSVDLLRAHVPLGGFEWGALQYAHVDGSWMLPLARIGGGRLVTFMTVLLGAALVHLVRDVVGRNGDTQDIAARLSMGLRDSRWPAGILVGGLLVTVLGTVEPPAAAGQPLDVVVAQGNDLEETDVSSEEEDEIVASNLLAVTRAALAGTPTPDLVVWPENAFDRDPWEPEGEKLVPILEEAASLTAGRLLAGVNREGPRDGTFQNSQVLVAADGSVADQYHKQHYVPFGEYVPWRSVLGGFPPLRAVPRDGIPERATSTIDVGRARIAIGICFESLFGSLLRHNILVGDQPANVVVMSTSDSTFGRTGEPEQHLSQSRMRAVESGRWIIHAASSGVTALIAPDGSVGERTALFTQASQRLEVPLVDGFTPWLRWGDLLDLPLTLGFLWLAAMAVRHRRAGSPADRDR